MKPKHQRLILIVLGIIMLCVGALLTLQAFRENIIFFYSPSDLINTPPPADQMVRVGGLVVADSINYGADKILTFKVTDETHTIAVRYQGIPPALFREGQGVVIEGTLEQHDMLNATRLLTKHDENYMPKEVAESLKRSGKWKESAP